MPLYEVLFDFTYQICEKFPQLTPLSIRRESAAEVCIFIARYITRNAKKNGTYKKKIEIVEDQGDWVF